MPIPDERATGVETRGGSGVDDGGAEMRSPPGRSPGGDDGDEPVGTPAAEIAAPGTGIGTGAAAPPELATMVFPRRAFRSIFGFFVSSAIGSSNGASSRSHTLSKAERRGLRARAR